MMSVFTNWESAYQMEVARLVFLLVDLLLDAKCSGQRQFFVILFWTEKNVFHKKRFSNKYTIRSRVTIFVFQMKYYHKQIGLEEERTAHYTNSFLSKHSDLFYTTCYFKHIF